MTDRTVREGEDIFRLGEPCDEVFTVVRGWAFLYTLLPDGGRQVLHYALAGDLIGYHPAHGATIFFGCQALTDVTVSVISRRGLDAIIRVHPEFGMSIMGILARNLTLSYDCLASIGRQTARGRIAHLLLQLYVRRRTQWPNVCGDAVELPLTQELIADTLGLTPVHVNRMLAVLRRENVLHFKLGRLRILNPDKLIDIAGLDPDIVSNWIDATKADCEVVRSTDVVKAAFSIDPQGGAVCEF